MAQGRKTKRRPQRDEKPDDNELSLLASVLAEHTLDTNAQGWFVLPWRSGRNAIRLARMAATHQDVVDWTGLDHATSVKILSVIDIEPETIETYERAAILHNALTYPKIDTKTARLLAVALRSLMILIAKSDGGGPVYNELLAPIFYEIPSNIVEDLVMGHRCLDAIGTTHTLRGDAFDKQRGAFRIAWRRGLYHAAYSIKPVK